MHRSVSPNKEVVFCCSKLFQLFESPNADAQLRTKD